ncbi:MAG TPA: metal ABC transporter permease [Acidimicrobiales bacterium]|nr:metal ABC transporter permease [Acidimicrobiales bacterium]
MTAALLAAVGWNLAHDVSEMLSYPFMQNAFEAGTVVALAAGIVGYFVVLRRSAFAAHALSHVGFAGGAGAALIAVNPLWGLLAFSVGAAAVMGGIGRRLRERDVVIGIVLMFALGLGYLFINLYQGSATDVYSILFGQIFGIDRFSVVLSASVSLGAVLVLGAIYRPLLFASVDPEVAEARRVPVGALNVTFMTLLGLTVAVAVQIVGVLLIFALLVAPAAAAERLAARPVAAIAASAAIAVGCTWIGLFLGFYFSPPVSFFITTLATGAYLAARLGSSVAWRGGLRGRRGARS